MASARIDPKTKLPRCPTAGTSMHLPIPINDRLNALVDLADETVQPTSKKEIVSALILKAPHDAKLVDLLVGYRSASARDAILSTGATESRPRRGPRPSSQIRSKKRAR